MGRNQGKLNLGGLGCRFLCLFTSCCTVDQHHMSLRAGPRCHRDQWGSDREDEGMGNEGQGPEKVPKLQLPQQGTKS